MPAGGGLFLSLCHPSSPLQLILTSRWIVAQSGKCDTPHIFLWICHFTYHRLTSRYRHNERRNGDIIPVRFGGGTVITHLSICCHQRKENDCVSGDERQNQSKPNMCERVVYDFVRNETPRALSPRVEQKKISEDVFYTTAVYIVCHPNPRSFSFQSAVFLLRH